MIEEIFIKTTETCQKHPVTLIRAPVAHRLPHLHLGGWGWGWGGVCTKYYSFIMHKRGRDFFYCLIKMEQKRTHLLYSWKGSYHTQNTDSKGDTLGFECTCGSYSVAVSQMFSLHISTGVSHLMAFLEIVHSSIIFCSFMNESFKQVQKYRQIHLGQLGEKL